MDLLGRISGGHDAGVLPGQFICGVIGELYSGVCAAVVIIAEFSFSISCVILGTSMSMKMEKRQILRRITEQEAEYGS